MKAVLTIRNLKTKEQFVKELDEVTSIRTLSQVLSTIINRKHYKNIKSVKIVDNYYQVYGLKIKIHYKDDIINTVYEYHFRGDDISIYYNN